VNQKLIRMLFLGVCWSAAAGLRAQDTLFLNDANYNLALDSTWQWAIEPPDADWGWQQAAAEGVFSPGPFSETEKKLQGALWLRFVVKKEHSDDYYSYLVLFTPDFADLYVVSDTGVLKKQGGMRTPVSEREVKQGYGFTFPVKFETGKPYTVYVRVSEAKGEIATISLALRDGFNQRVVGLSQMNNVLPGGIFIGMLAIMMLYNLILFFSVRDKAYLYYCLYLLCLGTGLYFDSMVRPMPALGFDIPLWNGLAGSVSFGASFIFYLLFGKFFIDLPGLSKRWNTLMDWLIWWKWLVLASGLAYGGFAGDFSEAFNFILLDNLLLMLLLPVFFVMVWRSGSVIGKYFIAGSVMVFFVGFLTVVINNVVYKINPFFIFSLAILAEILIFSLGLGYKMRKTQQEKLEAQQALNRELTKINTAFGRFVPHEFIRSLGKSSATEVHLGDQVEHEVTVMFSDIRDYTTLSEQMSPHDNFNFLNAYLGRIGPIIQQHGGFVNQYYGDGIMALFMNGADKALQAAVEMHAQVQAYNEYRQTKARPQIRIGIGLHTGRLMMGVIGDTLRLDTGVVSDTVNTAARMEGLTKFYKAGIVLSQTAYAQLEDPGRYAIRPLGKVLVKGKKEPLPVYECFGGDPAPLIAQKRAHLGEFLKGLAAYHDGTFWDALDHWRAAQDAILEDGAVSFFAHQTKIHIEKGVPAGWNGVETMTDK
jgi:class 3 adenylate cyclase